MISKTFIEDSFKEERWVASLSVLCLVKFHIVVFVLFSFLNTISLFFFLITDTHIVLPALFVFGPLLAPLSCINFLQTLFHHSDCTFYLVPFSLMFHYRSISSCFEVYGSGINRSTMSFHPFPV